MTSQLDAMRKLALPLFSLSIISLFFVGGRFASVRSAAASPIPPMATALAGSAPAALAALDLPPPTMDVPGPPSVTTLSPAKRTASPTPKPRGVYRCEIHPLQMGTVDTAVETCDWHDR